MSSKIKVSVILPVYNADKYIDQAINSILKQTLYELELIIVDDGSSDKSLEVIKKWHYLDDRIKIISRENKGLIYSLDEAIRLSKGKYIARMDADDISLPLRLQTQFEYMENNGCDICGCHYEKFTEDKNEVELVPTTEEMIKLSLVSQVPFAHPSVMIRKSFIDMNNLNYSNTGYCNAEDLALWMLMHTEGAKFGNVDDVLFRYRIHSTSLSNKNRANLIKDTRKMTRDYYLNNKIDLDTYFYSSVHNSLPRDSKILASYIAKSMFIHKEFKKSFFIHKVMLRDFLKACAREVKIKMGF